MGESCSDEVNDLWADSEVDHLTKGGRHFKPSYLENENPVEALEKGQRLEVYDEEDEVLKQLKKTQANITIWGLLMGSLKHRQTMIKLLNHVQVPIETSPEGLVSLITPVEKAATITFTEADSPKGRKDHMQALNITVDTLGKRVPIVLIDNGSALNVCPLRTATSLGLGPTDFVPSGQSVRAKE